MKRENDIASKQNHTLESKEEQDDYVGNSLGNSNIYKEKGLSKLQLKWRPMMEQFR